MDRGVLLVTGGSRGIGAAIARGAGASGWSVCLTYRDDKVAAARVRSEIEEAGGRAVEVKADATVEADSVRALAAAQEVGPVTAVVANAGILGPATRVADLSAERVQQTLATNVFGPIILCREAVRQMSTRYGGNGGSIVLISSLAARLGAPGEFVDYAASKGALESFAVGLAQEVAGEGVRVNVVRPAMTDTSIHASAGQPDRVERLGPSMPLGRAGRPEEVAAAVLWFLGDDATYCTGSILDVTGGR